MKKAALLCAMLGAIFFAGCAKEESATVETESTTTAPAGETPAETTVDTTVTTTTE